MSDLVNIERLVDLAPDSVSRTITKLLASFMKIKKLNEFYANSLDEAHNSHIVTALLDRMQISRLTKGFNVSFFGQFVAVVPVVSGFIEVMTAVSEIIELSDRNDVKVVPVDKCLRYFSLFKNYILPTSDDGRNIVYNSLKFLNSGGSLIYFVKMDSLSMKIDSTSLLIPYKLSRLSRVPLMQVLIDFDANLKTSWSTFINDWFFYVFAVRRFFGNSGTSVMINYSPLYLSDINKKIDNVFVENEFANFFSLSSGGVVNSIFNLKESTKSKFRFIVSRGTKNK